MELLDCGDHSCRFAKDKSGMRTNGGCRCLKALDEPLRLRIHATFHVLEQEVERLKDQGKTACNLFDDLKAAQLQNGALKEEYDASVNDLGHARLKLQQSERLKDELVAALKECLMELGAAGLYQCRASDGGRAALLKAGAVLTEKSFCPGHGVTHQMGECAEKLEDPSQYRCSKGGCDTQSICADCFGCGAHCGCKCKATRTGLHRLGDVIHDGYRHCLECCENIKI